jgi:phosphoglycolate phosphatase
MRLLLFDIDGTLLETHGVGRRAVEAALSELTGSPVSTEGISFSGKTDPQILREVLTASGADAPWLDGRFPEALAAYERTAATLLDPARVSALPGAVALVERLAAEGGSQLALLTGNIRPMAYRKVDALALGGYFPFGAFGCDHEDRNCLPAVAAERAEAHTGRRFGPEETVVIGDTPRDVECARAFGARVLAVATGRFSREELEAHDPDVLLDDLRDVSACLDALLA